MTLDDFEAYFEDIILDRGIDYFYDRHVLSLVLIDDTWEAEVAGTEDYLVTVKISDDGEILETYCDCPYDWSDFCKHQAAVFYALREELDPEVLTQRAAEKDALVKILKQRSKQELFDLMLEFAQKNKRIRETLFLRYAEASDSEE